MWEKFFNLYTLLAFGLGVVLAAMVKALIAQVKSHAAGAIGG